MKKRILCTGSSGFIGRNLMKYLPDADGLDIVPSPTTNIVADVCTFNKANEYDEIYHLAAVTNYEQFMSDPAEAYRTNLVGTMNLLNQSKGKRFIFASTVGVASEDWLNPYTLSKALAEQAITMMRPRQPLKPYDYSILRLQNIYGHNGNGVISKWLREDKITIYFDGEQKRDFTYIGDLIPLLTRPFHGLHCIGTFQNTTINKLAIEFQEVFGIKSIAKEPARKGDLLIPPMRAEVICPTLLREGLELMLSMNHP